jgi:uncharacterized membrane protein
MAFETFLRSAGAGASAGLRTFTIAAATLHAGGSPWAGLAIFIAATELVFDKLPVTPSRLGAPGLGARILSGGFCGAALAARADESRTIGALCGAATAVASAYTGFTIRRYLTKKAGWPDVPVALVEDALAVLVARDVNSSP